MSKLKLNARIKELIDFGIAYNHRSMFVIVGQNAKNQVPLIQHIRLKESGNLIEKEKILWLHKKDLNRSLKKQEKQIQKKMTTGQLNFDLEDPFDLFLLSSNIQYCQYNDTQQILGQTYSMCILQNFEAITPNILARTIETVYGGGIIIILLDSVQSITDISHMFMDVHKNFQTESHSNVTGHFNERFLLSLSSCLNCLVVDDHLNILSLSCDALINRVFIGDHSDREKQKKKLKKLKKELLKNKSKDLLSFLVDCCVTFDQGSALIKFISALSDKEVISTVVITAARGRGKSAALGLGLASAVVLGFTNIFVTAPNPVNLSTVFEFICIGLKAMNLKEDEDYQLIFSEKLEYNKSIVQMNILKNHRQTIQYISPAADVEVLKQADLLCIDEAASIPLPLVKKLLGSYIVFMSSTVVGYEGTGRSLSLKLINDLRQRYTSSQSNQNEKTMKHRLMREKIMINADVTLRSSKTVRFDEMTLHSPIRYSDNDPIESWLYDLLCLNVNHLSLSSSSFPNPSDCQLFYVDRQTLFSYHEKTEEFLKRLVSIYASSHYKNTPNDLQMLSDAPAHHVFCLLGPNLKNDQLPEILTVLQVAFEGKISKNSVKKNLERGERASGDLIPWTIQQQFDGYDFASKCGLRVVRIATNPDFQRMGYGSRTLQLLEEYFEGKVRSLSMTEIMKHDDEMPMNECLKKRKNLPPLLLSLNHRQRETLDYIGVGFGITQELLKFWKRFGMVPVYVRQTTNDLTGEHSCIMIKLVNSVQCDMEPEQDGIWLKDIWIDFRKRFLRLLSHDFRMWKISLALDLIHHKMMKTTAEVIPCEALQKIITESDLSRLQRYSDNLVDYRLIKDLIQPLALLYFYQQIQHLHLNAIKSAILLGIGLQGKSVDDLVKELDTKERNFPANQILALLNQVIRSLVQSLKKQKQQEGNGEKCEKKSEIGDEEETESQSMKKKHHLTCEENIKNIKKVKRTD